MQRWRFFLRHREILCVLGVAIIVTGIINAPLWHALLVTDEWQWNDIVAESSDDLFYMIRIREVADGHPSIGNPVFFERRDQSYPLGSLAEKIVSVPLGAPGWRLKTLSIAMDAFFPALLVLILWFAVRPLLPPKRWRTLLIAFVFLGGSIAFWKRPISPQATTVLPLLYLWLFLSAHATSWKKAALRSALIGLMVHSYPFHWTYCLAAEGLLFVWTAFSKKKNVRELGVQLVAALLPFFLLAVPWIYSLQIWLPVPAYNETMSRLGLVARRLPAAPLMQVQIMLCALALWFWTRTKKMQHAEVAVFLLLFAGIAVLWQPLVTGKEGEFSSHYVLSISLAMSLAVVFLIHKVTETNPRWSKPILFVSLALLGMSTFRATEEGFATFQSARPAPEVRQEMEQRLQLFADLPEEQIIFTTNTFASALLLYTDHYAYTFYDAYMYLAPDEEVRKRAVVYNTLVPSDRLSERAVVGTRYLNAGLYERTKCVLQNTLLLQENTCEREIVCTECDAITNPPPLSDETIVSSLVSASVQYIFLEDLPPVLVPWTKEVGSAGGMTLYTFTPPR